MTSFVSKEKKPSTPPINKKWLALHQVIWETMKDQTTDRGK